MGEMHFVFPGFVLSIFISSWELKLVKISGWDRKQLLEGDSMTSGSQLWHKSWPLLKQRGWRVRVCLGHHHREMSRAKRDTYPTTLPLPSYPLGALHIDFTSEVKTVWCVQFKPTPGRPTMEEICWVKLPYSFLLKNTRRSAFWAIEINEFQSTYWREFEFFRCSVSSKMKVNAFNLKSE